MLEKVGESVVGVGESGFELVEVGGGGRDQDLRTMLKSHTH